MEDAPQAKVSQHTVSTEDIQSDNTIAPQDEVSQHTDSTEDIQADNTMDQNPMALRWNLPTMETIYIKLLEAFVNNSTKQQLLDTCDKVASFGKHQHYMILLLHCSRSHKMIFLKYYIFCRKSGS